MTCQALPSLSDLINPLQTEVNNLCITQCILQMQQEQMNNLPDRIQKSSERVQQAMGKLKALQALQPEWMRLQKLKTTVIKAVEGKARQLEVEVAGKAHAAGELHDRKHELEAALQVCLL